MEFWKNWIVMIGVYNILLIVFHILFWKMFNWKKETKRMSIANRAVIQIMNVQLIVFFLLMAIMAFVFQTELLTSKIGKFCLIIGAVFWLVRLLNQFIFLRINNIKIHILTFVWFIGTLLYTIPLFK